MKKIEVITTYVMRLIQEMHIKDGNEHLAKQITIDTWKLAMAFRKAFSDGVTRAKAFHRRMDNTVANMLVERRMNGQPLPVCGPNCSWCCHMLVGVSPDEAALLTDIAIARGIDLEKLKKQETYGIDDYMRVSFEDAACVFLKDNTCSIYEDRPCSCRGHFITSTVDHCISTFRDKVEIEEKVHIDSISVEMVTAAAFTANKKSSGSYAGGLALPKQIMIRLRKKKPEWFK